MCWSVLYKEAAPRHVVPPRSSSIAPVLNQVLWVHDHLDDLIMESWLFDVGLPAWHVDWAWIGVQMGAMTCKETIQTRKYIWNHMKSYEECDWFAYYTYYTSSICKPFHFDCRLAAWVGNSEISLTSACVRAHLALTRFWMGRWAYQNTTVPSHKYWLINSYSYHGLIIMPNKNMLYLYNITCCTVW